MRLRIAVLCFLQALAGNPEAAPAKNLRSIAAQRVGDGRVPPVAVIGAGFSGLSAALELKQLGHDVVIYEQSAHVGGRGYAWSEKGFTFDAGPSWYWMPEIFDQIFIKHGRHSSEYYNLTRLDPAYSVYFDKGVRTDVPGTFDKFLAWAEKVEPEATQCIHDYFDNAKIMYDKGIGEWIWKPMVSLKEFIDWDLIKSALTMNMFGSLEKDITKCVKTSKLQQVLKWPVIFLGASPKEAPAMYSLMTYAGHAKGTWYPDGGMSAPAKALSQLAREEGVQIKLSSKVERLIIKDGKVDEVCVNGNCDRVSGVIASGDYHHLEMHLLPLEYRRYKEDFWDNQVLSPSVFLYYLGVNKTLPLEHHTFFFDDRLDKSLKAAIEDHVMEVDPVFYVTSTSRVDSSTAPPDSSALFILVPISYTLNGTDTKAVRDAVFQSIARRMEVEIGPFQDSIVYKRDYGPSDFEQEFGAFRGNAFGHANLLEQSLIFKPSMDSMLRNMVFTGHLTNPGPGVPPALASGATAAHLLQSKLNPGVHIMWILNLAGALLLLWRMSMSTKMQRSKHACMRLLYNHGRTFFAGASLMKVQEFLDTSALYGLFRIADDCVDDVDDHESRRRRLDDFEGKFWKAWESKETDCYADHPVLPAVIEVSSRLRFPRSFFELFFKSMRADVYENICRNMDDTYEYIEGSAAVVGEFMLPILMPDSTEEERDLARPHAKDLGRAFQLTNFCRDIDEDIDIQRQYIPEDLCKKHGVDLSKRSCQQGGFRDLIEEIFSECDKLYTSADKGIAMLPERVRPVVLVASRLYQQIQDEVRNRGYNVFEERVRVPTKKKVKIALEEISLVLTMKMIAAELLLLFVFFLDEVTIPFVTLLAAYQLCDAASWPTMSYYAFHCVFTLPPLAFMYFYARRHAESPEYFQEACKWIALLCLIATVYTTPWDNYLVASGVWGYGSLDHTLGLIGYVPIEEYAFFCIETMLVGLIWVAHARCNVIPHFREETPWRNVGLVAFAVLTAAGILLLQTERGTYLGLITVWAMPVLALQWAFGANALMAQKSSWSKPLFYSWAYLCIIDRFAIRNGCWSINPKHSLPLIDWLPFEEAYFFACTATMCTWGLQLAMNVAVLDCPRPMALQRVIFWCRKLTKREAPSWTPATKHTAFAIGLSLFAMLFAYDFTTEAQVAMLVFATTMSGLPYIILDMTSADWFQIKKKRILSLYVAFACSVVFAWCIVPRAMLTLFILTSVYHFGKGDTTGNKASHRFDLLARGGMILIPIKFHAAEVATICTFLTGSLDMEPVMTVLSYIGYLHMAALFLSFRHHFLNSHFFEHLVILLELATLCVVFVTMPPLMSFGIYFNIFFSARQLVRLRDAGLITSPTKVGWLQSQAFLAFGASIITVMVLVACFMPGGLQAEAVGPFARAVFVGLSALKIPRVLAMSVLPPLKGKHAEV